MRWSAVYIQRIIFFRHNGLYLYHSLFGPVASLKFLVTENMPSPPFGPCLRSNGWMDQDTTSYGGRSRPRRHCVTWKVARHPHFCAHCSDPHSRRPAFIP